MADPSAPEHDRGRPVAVTGAAGHLGANLVRALVADGRHLRALVRHNRAALAGLPVEIVAADVLDEAALRSAFVGVTTVFHLAAKISAGWERAATLDAVNVRGTANVVRACQAAGVRRLIHFSSIQALAARAGDVLDERAPLVEPTARHRGPYDLAKANAERVVLDAVAAGLDAVILNPTAVIGPNDFVPSPMGDCLRALARGRLPALVAPASHDFVDARDVAAAALAAEQHGRRGERYIVAGTRMSLTELAARWAAVAGRPAPRFSSPMWLARAAAPFAASWARCRRRRPLLTPESLRILRWSTPVDGGKAQRELGIRPRPIDETLRDTWAWMQEQRA
jgi:dihydroflavonol-4-reductase